MELVGIATTLREQLVAQRIRTEEITYITDKLIPTVEDLAGLAADDNAEAVGAIKKLVSVEMLTVLQLVGFNFKAAIGEPLTQVVEGLILQLARANHARGRSSQGSSAEAPRERERRRGSIGAQLSATNRTERKLAGESPLFAGPERRQAGSSPVSPVEKTPLRGVARPGPTLQGPDRRGLEPRRGRSVWLGGRAGASGCGSTCVCSSSDGPSRHKRALISVVAPRTGARTRRLLRSGAAPHDHARERTEQCITAPPVVRLVTIDRKPWPAEFDEPWRPWVTTCSAERSTRRGRDWRSGFRVPRSRAQCCGGG